MAHFGLWMHHCSRMQTFMKAALTISRKRCLVQMKISSRSIPRNILSLLSSCVENIGGRFVGTLSKLFCLFKDNRLKKQVAREFGLPQYTYLESWIRCITVLRNCCAHHARIWNRRFALKPQLPNRLPLSWIAPTQKPIKLYHQLCTLLYMEQTITPCMDLKSSLLRLLADYPNIDLHAMGFPQGWENEPLWR